MSYSPEGSETVSPVTTHGVSLLAIGRLLCSPSSHTRLCRAAQYIPRINTSALTEDETMPV